MTNKNITEDVTKSVADLARLELSADEVACFTEQLGNVLSYIEKLNEVNVSGVDPLYNPVEMALFLREDLVVDSEKDEKGQPKVLSSAPEVLYEGYKVPQIL